MQLFLRFFAFPVGLVLGVRTAMHQALDQTGTPGCPGDDVAKWGKVLGCGNFGCAVFAQMQRGEAVVKVGPKIDEKEVQVLATLSALGDGSCPAGQLDERQIPCVLTPNVLHLYGSGSCNCGVPEDLPQSVRAAILAGAKSRGKKVPDLSGDCTELVMERVHSDVKTYPGLTSHLAFARAIVLQTIFAYHVAFRQTGFVHKDIMNDNIALKCLTTWTGSTCTPPPRGQTIYCYSFEHGQTPFCIDLADTDGTVVVLIDFGLSKLHERSVPKNELMMARMLANKLKVQVEFAEGTASSSPWATGTEYFKDMQPSDGVPGNALIFGF